jgi:dUTP pyrophosphatase
MKFLDQKINMKIKIKKLHDDAVIPLYAKEGDAGMDLVATTKVIDSEIVEYGTGLSIEIPEGYVGLIFPRSSIYKTGLQLCNAVGVIDSGYRGEIKFKFMKKEFHKQPLYSIGDRIGQILILPYPKIEFNEVSELSISERGLNGFGSTGQN